MKKIMWIVLGLLLGVSAISAQDFVAEYTEKKMLMPDGATADLYFFKKWGTASKLANDKTKWQGKHSAMVKTENDSDLGYGNIWHKSDDNETIQAIYNKMKEHGTKFAVAYASFDKRLRRYVFTCENGRLRNSFMDFFDEAHKFYIAYKEKEDAKQEKLNGIGKGIANAIFSPIANGAEAASNNNENHEQFLYRVRHETHTFTHHGSYKGSGLKVFSYRNIYRDDGKIVNEYIVDLDGNIRRFMGVGSDFEKNYPIVQYYSVPKEIRDLAQKSLD